MSDTLKNQLARFQIANPHSPIGTKGFVNNAFTQSPNTETHPG